MRGGTANFTTYISHLQQPSHAFVCSPTLSLTENSSSFSSHDNPYDYLDMDYADFDPAENVRFLDLYNKQIYRSHLTHPQRHLVRYNKKCA